MTRAHCRKTRWRCSGRSNETWRPRPRLCARYAQARTDTPEHTHNRRAGFQTTLSAARTSPGSEGPTSGSSDRWSLTQARIPRSWNLRWTPRPCDPTVLLLCCKGGGVLCQERRWIICLDTLTFLLPHPTKKECGHMTRSPTDSLSGRTSCTPPPQYGPWQRERRTFAAEVRDKTAVLFVTCKTAISCPLSTLQSRAVLSTLPVATNVLSGWKETLITSAVWPRKVWKHFPVSVLHSWMRYGEKIWGAAITTQEND